MKLSYNNICNIISESIIRVLKEDEDKSNISLANSLLNNSNNQVLWRVFFSKTEKSIFENGYTSEYFGDGEGSYHGTGVYAFYKPIGAQKRVGGPTIGDKIMKCVLINGFKDFLILDGPMAIKYYNSDDIRVQLNHLYNDKTLINNITNEYIKLKGSTKLSFNSTTGYISKGLYEKFKNKLRAGISRGVVYNGNNDPFACVIYNPREIIPIAVTNERTYHGNDFKSWNYELTNDLYEKITTILDYHSYGERLKAMNLIRDYSKQPPVNNCMNIILPNGKPSLYDVLKKEFISKQGFEQCFSWQTIDNGENGQVNVLPVKVNGSIFYLKENKKNGKYYFYEKIDDYEQVISLKTYDSLVNKEQEVKTLNEGFNDIYGDVNTIDVYHRCDDVACENIFRKGFSKEFTGEHANIAGPGIYITFSSYDSTMHTRGYGRNMIKCKLINGLDNFLIPKGVSIQGKHFNESIESQFNRLVLPQFKDEMLKKYASYIKYNSASSLYKAIDNNNDLGKTTIRGIIYDYGCWAGVAIDWKSVIPYKVSRDNGKTWDVGLTKDNADFMKSHGDSKFSLNKFIANGIIKNTFGKGNNSIEANQQFEKGYLKVILNKNNKISFYSAKDDDLISYRGFDKGFGAQVMDIDGEKITVIPVQTEGKDYFIFKEENGEYWLYEKVSKYKSLRLPNGEIVDNTIYDNMFK